MEDLNSFLRRTFDARSEHKAIVREHTDKSGKYSWIIAITSYSKAEEVIADVLRVALKHGLSMLDRQNDDIPLSDSSAVLNSEKIGFYCRGRVFSDTLHKFKQKRSVREIEKTENRISYVVTLRKFSKELVEKTTRDLYACLGSMTLPTEVIILEDKSFKISTNGGVFTVCIEIYKNNANQICYIEKDGIFRTVLICRMDCYTALKKLRAMTDCEKEDTLSRMKLHEMVRNYPNPADRLAQSVKITDTLKKEWFNARYSGISSIYGGDIVFHRTKEHRRALSDNNDGISQLTLSEESAAPILAIIHDVYPYIYERYYDANPLPIEMWEQVAQRMKEVSDMLIFDSANPQLLCYFNLHTLSDFFWRRARKEQPRERLLAKYENDPKVFLYK